VLNKEQNNRFSIDKIRLNSSYLFFHRLQVLFDHHLLLVNFVLQQDHNKHLLHLLMFHDFLNFIIYLNICFYLLFVLPSSTTDPLLSTIIFDALTIVDKRCAMTMVVRPFDARSRASCTTRSLSVS